MTKATISSPWGHWLDLYAVDDFSGVFQTHCRYTAEGQLIYWEWNEEKGRFECDDVSRGISFAVKPPTSMVTFDGHLDHKKAVDLIFTSYMKDWYEPYYPSYMVRERVNELIKAVKHHVPCRQ